MAAQEKSVLLFRDYHVSYEIELESWGIVNMFYANSADGHSIPLVFLTNKQGDIIYQFSAAYQSDSEVLSGIFIRKKIVYFIWA